ncbi:hypothetical protein [Fulvimonas soli]|jgi:hypothetical protein|uniref:Uncharacterized protein n=1 Tax=Fulvimonas soli TaxID=155197 RepID=A0A316I4G1_9GAMM|nr:hypothetical protein [Fulvimonas soli]PWK85314.1 hypothetical protein C7456_10988 [Fulvimonas soli]TNY27380.1 hypothetical protein BV497_03920 [Fulvimonas soli]
MNLRNLALPLMLASAGAATAQTRTDLPGVDVTAPAYTSTHGGYLISGDFKVDPRMPYVVFPAQALAKDDILSIEPVHLQDDEYLVLQECATADCTRAAIVRVWNADGAASRTTNSGSRIWITHESKYFIWLKRLPLTSAQCATCRGHYYQFVEVSPPMTLIPEGEMAALDKERLDKAYDEPPVKVQGETHEGSTYVVTYEGGSKVRIRRMHGMR